MSWNECERLNVATNLNRFSVVHWIQFGLFVLHSLCWFEFHSGIGWSLGHTIHWLSIERFSYASLYTFKFDHTLSILSFFSPGKKGSGICNDSMIEWKFVRVFPFFIRCVTMAAFYVASKTKISNFFFCISFTHLTLCCPCCSSGFFSLLSLLLLIWLLSHSIMYDSNMSN